jgi:hypothetical protein
VARRGHRSDQLADRARALGAIGIELLDRVGATVVRHDLVAVAHEPARHVGAHPAESDRSELHLRSPL